MVESVLTPPHPDPFEALLDEPFTCAFHHAAAQRQAQFLVHVIVDVLAMPVQIGIHGTQGVPCGRRQPLHLQGLRQVGQHPVRHAVPQAVACPPKPPAGLGRPPIQPGRRTLPQLLCGVIKVQDARGMARKALLKQAPQPAAAITEPDHLRRTPDALPQRFQPQTRREHLDIAQDGHQPALQQPGHEMPGARAMLAQASQHAHFDLAPADLALRLSALGPKRHHDAIGPQSQRQGRLGRRQRLWRRLMPLRHGGQLGLEALHGVVAGCLHPPPHRTGTDHAPTVPAQQPRCGRKRHKDGQGTAQRLQFPARPLIWLHPQRLIQRRHLWDRTALGTPADPALPPDRPKQARHLTRGKALTS